MFFVYVYVMSCKLDVGKAIWPLKIKKHLKRDLAINFLLISKINFPLFFIKML
jgi:hypothetical protein